MKVGPQLPRACVLPGGQKLSIRAITPSDREALRAAFHALTPETRYRRFAGHVSDLTPTMLDYLTEVDGFDHFAIVAVAGERKRLEIIGVARMIRLTREPTAAEVAITVTDSLQGLGLGTKLLHTLVEAAAERGIDRLVAHVLDSNHRMRHVLAKEGELEATADGAVYVALERPKGKLRIAQPRSFRDRRAAFERVVVAWLRRPQRLVDRGRRLDA